MTKINWLKLVGAILICQATGWIGAIFTAKSVSTWYLTLNKSSLNPPGWLFAPVWTLLFLLMGISLYLVWQGRGGKLKNLALNIFFVQLVLNVLWSFCFFYLQNPLAGFIEIIILWLFILLTIVYFYKLNKVAAYLLIPYILWVSFAAVLNLSLYLLNS